jgi:hypothetical protein
MSDEDDTSSNDGLEEVVAVKGAPSLYTRPIYYRQTRKRGKILKTVSERYLREDLGFGCYYAVAQKARTDVDKVHGKPVVISTAKHLLTLLQPGSPLVICDTNVLLHNMDVLEQAATTAMPNIVIPQTALQECRSNRMVAYDRTVDLLRTVGRVRVSFSFPIYIMSKQQRTASSTHPQTTKMTPVFGESLPFMRIACKEPMCRWFF